MAISRRSGREIASSPRSPDDPIRSPDHSITKSPDRQIARSLDRQIARCIGGSPPPCPIAQIAESRDSQITRSQIAKSLDRQIARCIGGATGPQFTA